MLVSHSHSHNLQNAFVLIKILKNCTFVYFFEPKTIAKIQYYILFTRTATNNSKYDNILPIEICV